MELVRRQVLDRGKNATVEAGRLAACLHSLDDKNIFPKNGIPAFQDSLATGGISVLLCCVICIKDLQLLE